MPAGYPHKKQNHGTQVRVAILCGAFSLLRMWAASSLLARRPGAQGREIWIGPIGLIAKIHDAFGTIPRNFVIIELELPETPSPCRDLGVSVSQRPSLRMGGSDIYSLYPIANQAEREIMAGSTRTIDESLAFKL